MRKIGWRLLPLLLNTESKETDCAAKYEGETYYLGDTREDISTNLFHKSMFCE